MARPILEDVLAFTLILACLLTVAAALWGLARDAYRWLLALINRSERDLPDASDDDPTYDLAA